MAGLRLLFAAATAAKSLQLCLTLCDPIDGSPPGSPVPGILQARVLQWVAIAFSEVQSLPQLLMHMVIFSPLQFLSILLLEERCV